MRLLGHYMLTLQPNSRDLGDFWPQLIVRHRPLNSAAIRSAIEDKAAMVRRLTGRVRVPHAVIPHVALSQHAHRWIARGPRAHSPSSIPPTRACLCLSARALPQDRHGAGDAPSSRAWARVIHLALLHASGLRHVRACQPPQARTRGRAIFIVASVLAS